MTDNTDTAVLRHGKLTAEQCDLLNVPIPTEPLDDPWAELERLAKAATPGEWRVNAGVAQVDVPDRDAPICQMLWPTDLRSEAETYANAAFIAAAKRDALKLIEAARQGGRK